MSTYSLPIKVNSGSNNTDNILNVEIDCRIYPVRRGRDGRRATAVLDYFGFTLGDIQVYERRGQISIVYPTREIRRKGELREASVYFPNNRELGQNINHIINQEYLNVVKHNDVPVLEGMGIKNGQE